MTTYNVGDKVAVELEMEVLGIASSNGELELYHDESAIEFYLVPDSLEEGITLTKIIKPFKAGDFVEHKDSKERYLILRNRDGDGENYCLEISSEWTHYRYRTFDPDVYNVLQSLELTRGDAQ